MLATACRTGMSICNRICKVVQKKSHLQSSFNLDAYKGWAVADSLYLDQENKMETETWLLNTKTALNLRNLLIPLNCTGVSLRYWLQVHSLSSQNLPRIWHFTVSFGEAAPHRQHTGKQRKQVARLGCRHKDLNPLTSIRTGHVHNAGTHMQANTKNIK